MISIININFFFKHLYFNRVKDHDTTFVSSAFEKCPQVLNKRQNFGLEESNERLGGRGIFHNIIYNCCL